MAILALFRATPDVPLHFPHQAPQQQQRGSWGAIFTRCLT